MESSRLQPCGSQDPRLTEWPCNARHKTGKIRQNQFASWSTCARCGLRLTYEVKPKGHEETRSAGPHPNLVRLALDQLQQSMSANDCTEKIVMGKVMELKGLQMQRGLTETMAINLTFQEYAKQMGAQVESKTLLPEAQSSAPNEASPKKKSEESGIAQYDLIRMAAAEYLLKKTGMDSLDPEEFKAAVEAHIAKAAEEAPEPPKTPVKTEGRMKTSKKKMTEPVDIFSSEEEKVIPNGGSAASGQH